MATTTRRRSTLLALLLAAGPLTGQTSRLPGKGLAQYDFLYAGEAMTRDVYIVRSGKVAWEFHDDAAKGEISDIQMASSGNVVIAHQFGVKVVTPDKKTLWSHPADEKHEIHTAQFIGRDRVIFVQSGMRPRIIVANIASNTIERTIPIGAANLANTHGQLRHARLTPQGTYLLAQMDLKRAVEIDEQGREVWQLAAPGIWSATRLANGHTLVTGKNGVTEYSPAGDAVWTLKPEDVKDWRYGSFQVSYRLSNGNTLVNHWVNQWSAPDNKIDGRNAPPQWLEVTSDKRVVWALHQWDQPNLGPSTILQLLDRSARPEEVRFGAIH
ncbi:hypothetical protein GJV26_03320 [Massilia dura]|uniref:PQQ-binding-like beta-propeller repeat protein n=1 Tax=Pseudoduganella dura TaxID=321982 RepID=A0A6I3XBP4_9BURK|nr:hypothetical protein [Pseudoduganella dura]MUI11523.1 hypothetical protein [Pseudoduganella dura]GGX97138.1 hypothetical protein GCM10007386_30040 [Pseudoduganella dura]